MNDLAYFYHKERVEQANKALRDVKSKWKGRTFVRLRNKSQKFIIEIPKDKYHLNRDNYIDFIYLGEFIY